MRSMLLYPAIDVAGGQAVRLRQGRAAQMRVVHPDPVELAEHFAAAGAPWLHVVDIDAALGTGSNRAVLARLVGRVACPVEVGGGVRSWEDIQALKGVGVARVVLGTAAQRDGALLARALAHDAEAVAVAADTRSGTVVVSGWTADSGEPLAGFAARMRGEGVRHLIVTAVERDGTGTGPDLEVLRAALAAFGPGVIASGGVGRVEDVERLGTLAAAGLAGVIVGTLLVEGRATVGELLARLGGG
ncbi:MAG: 1-(5-phosphoribosyl)-5-[(5-phosphoribosylamino)methylideneamino] imidazole-4-carboxamide isomerase [Thermoanaerobaculaceae bacterium]|nr:1-(5-phosphoribosyl)-5-[(5-phosphoribosylamino)methylideneamino] imidazole-4-carboxamide isomerase [Thermoanaerobaculaceae bacterium]